MSRTEPAKRALRDAEHRSVRDDRAVVEAAVDAMDDLDRASRFVETVGITELERAIRAVARAGEDDLAKEGRAALWAFRRFQRVARGDHFHPGRGTPLGGDGQGAHR